MEILQENASNNLKSIDNDNKIDFSREKNKNRNDITIIYSHVINTFFKEINNIKFNSKRKITIDFQEINDLIKKHVNSSSL